jgi:hypothetical protein
VASEAPLGLALLRGGVLTLRGNPPPTISRRDSIVGPDRRTLPGPSLNRTITVSAGAFVHIPKGTLHCFKNVGETPARMLIFFTPAGFEKFFFEVGQLVKEGETAPPLGPEEIERILAAAPKHGLEVRLPPER